MVDDVDAVVVENSWYPIAGLLAAAAIVGAILLLDDDDDEDDIPVSP